MTPNFILTQFDDYKVLATLFDRSLAGVAADGNDSELLSDFKKLKISNNITKATEAFDYMNGIIIDEIAPPERLITKDEAEKFREEELSVLRIMENKLKNVALSKDESIIISTRQFNIMSDAEKALQKSILEKPNGNLYSSVFNNLGQIRRMQYELVLQEALPLGPGYFKLDWFNEYELKIFAVLKQAISIALPPKTHMGSWFIDGIVDDENFILQNESMYKFSTEQIKILESSYLQLAAISLRRSIRLHKIVQNLKSHLAISKSDRELMITEKNDLEAMLSEYLRISGVFGSNIAQQAAVSLNPLAKACGEIVRNSLIGSCVGDSY